MRRRPWSSREYEQQVPDELNIGLEAGSLMAHSTGVSGLIPGSRLEAPTSTRLIPDCAENYSFSLSQIRPSLREGYKTSTPLFNYLT